MKLSPLRVPVSSSGLLKSRRPSQMPTRERSAPISAWSCRHCPQDCAPSALATLGPMPPPPGRACAFGIIPLHSIMGKSPVSRPNTPRNTGDMPASRFAQVSATHATRISKLDTTRQCPCLLFQHPQLLIECMKLQDFLRDSLLEIMNGVAEARKINRNIGGCVEALGKQDASCKFKDGEVGFLVNFDVAVTVSQKNSKEAGAGIQVVAINAGGRGFGCFRAFFDNKNSIFCAHNISHSG